MNYRKLRIAWSVAWGVIAMLLCVLWVLHQREVERASYVVRCDEQLRGGIGV